MELVMAGVGLGGADQGPERAGPSHALTRFNTVCHYYGRLFVLKFI